MRFTQNGYQIIYEEELINLFKSHFIKGILCPVQSASTRILDLMQREHSSEDIKTIFKKIRHINPNIHLNTQIIAGFPSESEAEFDETLDFIKDVHFNYVVVFPYHDKENTIASKLENKIPRDIINYRMKEARKCLKEEKIKVYFKCP